MPPAQAATPRSPPYRRRSRPHRVDRAPGRSVPERALESSQTRAAEGESAPAPFPAGPGLQDRGPTGRPPAPASAGSDRQTRLESGRLRGARRRTRAHRSPCRRPAADSDGAGTAVPEPLRAPPAACSPLSRPRQSDRGQSGGPQACQPGPPPDRGRCPRDWPQGWPRPRAWHRHPRG